MQRRKPENPRAPRSREYLCLMEERDRLRERVTQLEASCAAHLEVCRRLRRQLEDRVERPAVAGLPNRVTSLEGRVTKLERGRTRSYE